MPILYRPGVTGSKHTKGRFNLKIGGVAGWALDRREAKYALYDHLGEKICEGDFDECLNIAAKIAQMGVNQFYEDKTPDTERRNQ